MRSITRSVLAHTAYQRVNIKLLVLDHNKTCVQVVHHDRDDRVLGCEVYVPACEVNDVNQTIEAIEAYVEGNHEPTVHVNHEVTGSWCPGDATRYDIALTPSPVPRQPDRYVLAIPNLGWTMLVWKDQPVNEDYMRDKFRTSCAVGGVLRFLEIHGFTVEYTVSDGRTWKL